MGAGAEDPFSHAGWRMHVLGHRGEPAYEFVSIHHLGTIKNGEVAHRAGAAEGHVRGARLRGHRRNRISLSRFARQAQHDQRIKRQACVRGWISCLTPFI